MGPGQSAVERAILGENDRFILHKWQICETEFTSKMGSEHLKWDLAAPNARLLEPMPIAQDGRLEGDAKSQLQLEESTSDSEEVQEPSYSPSYSPDYEPDSVLHAKNSRVYRLGFLQQLTDNKLDSLADKVTNLAVTKRQETVLSLSGGMHHVLMLDVPKEHCSSQKAKTKRQRCHFDQNTMNNTECNRTQ